MPFCLIALGSNLGNRRDTLRAAVDELDRHDGIRVLRVSRWYETKPVGGPGGQQTFLNGAALLETSRQPRDLFSVLKQTESRLGRVRVQRWGPRTLDLDLLLYNDLRLDTPGLVIPHPRMAWRRFVLEPAAEIAPSMLHPTTGWSMQKLLDHLNTAPDYAAIAGAFGTAKTTLAGQLTEAASAQAIMEPVDLEYLRTFFPCDPSGARGTVELEFLDRWADLLSASRPGWHEQVTVSNFWFDEFLVLANLRLPPDRLAAFHEKWLSARQDVLKPKLIVLLHEPVDSLFSREQRRSSGISAAELNEVQRAIWEQAMRPDQGPVLPLPASDTRAALAEIQAAVASMRSFFPTKPVIGP